MLQQLLNDESSIRVAVVRFLARREYSRYELCERLKLRVASLTELDNVLADLQNQGLISDQRFCESFVRCKVDSGDGPLKIKQALFHKGVDEALIESVLADYDEQWYDRAFKVWCKRFGLENRHSEGAARQMRFLQSRGFMFEHIQAALKRGSQQVSEE